MWWFTQFVHHYSLIYSLIHLLLIHSFIYSLLVWTIFHCFLHPIIMFAWKFTFMSSLGLIIYLYLYVYPRWNEQMFEICRFTQCLRVYTLIMCVNMYMSMKREREWTTLVIYLSGYFLISIPMCSFIFSISLYLTLAYTKKVYNCEECGEMCGHTNHR